MKTKIISIIVAILLTGALSYQAYVLYTVKKQGDLMFNALNALVTPDKNGVTEFDKLVVQTINKINQNGKK